MWKYVEICLYGAFAGIKNRMMELHLTTSSNTGEIQSDVFVGDTEEEEEPRTVQVDASECFTFTSVINNLNYLK